jgi:acetate kinase
MSASELDELLNQQSGLLGLSGKSADIRKLLTANDQASRLALDVYVYRLQKYIGAYLVALGGADAIVFGGGVGENSARIRAAVLNNLQWCGVQLDAQRNEEVSASDGCFSLPESMIEAWTIQVNEAQIIAEQSMQILSRA